MSTLFLIDASGYVFRAFYALPPLKKSNGTPVGAVYGFCNMLLKLLPDLGNHHIIAVFDKSRQTFRQQIYPQYKANRSDPPPELIPQFPLFREACIAFSLPIAEVDGFEADDIIATYAHMADQAGQKVVIISSDKDLMQLVNENITMFDPIKNKIIDHQGVIEKFGVPPYQVVDVQALSGDSSDNVPGVPGIGIKTACELILKFGSLENLLNNLDEILQEKRRLSLQMNITEAKISYQLVSLRKDANLPFLLNDLKPLEINIEKRDTFLKDQEFTNLLNRLSKNTEATSTPSTKNYQTIQDFDTLKIWIDWAKRAGHLAIDCETTSLQAMQAQLVGISLAVKIDEEIKANYIPLRHKEQSPQLDFNQCLNLLQPILMDQSVLKIGHNIKYDLLVFKNYGINVSPVSDSMLLSYCISAGKHGHSLDELAKIHFNHQNITFKEVIGKNKTFDEVAIEQATAYAAEDAEITLRLHNKLMPELLLTKKANIYQSIEQPLIPVIVEMEKCGIKVDATWLKNLRIEFALQLKTLEAEIHELAEETFNIASPKQLGDILFNKFNMPNPKKTKMGAFVTDAESLEKLAYQGYELPRKVLEWRSLAKLQSTYIDGLILAINPKTNRVHTSFSMVGTATGRLSSSDPNLQNIPIRTTDGRKIRQAFIAESGFKLVSLDYSQIELRLLAHFAEAPSLQEAFRNGLDIHKITASEIFEIPLEQINTDQRRKAKTINFGIIYGISAFGLAQQLAISNSEAAHIIKSYFERYPGIESYMDKCRQIAKDQGYVETLMGRRCYTLGINDSNAGIRHFAERQAINAPLQGSNADIIKKAMIKIHQFLINHKSRMILQVHDELLFEVPLSELDSIPYELKAIMENITTLKVPLLVDIGVGNNWDQAY